VPRMADAALWCCAVAEALGVGWQSFLNAYRVNIGEVEESTVRSSPIGEPLLAFLEAALRDRETVAVTPTKLLAHLKQYAEAEGQSLKTGGFPPDSTRLSKELNKIKANLPKLGYHLRDSKVGGTRKKVFTRIKSTKLTEDYAPSRRNVNVWGAEDLRHVLDSESYRRDGSRREAEKRGVEYGLPGWLLAPGDAELPAGFGASGGRKVLETRGSCSVPDIPGAFGEEQEPGVVGEPMHDVPCVGRQGEGIATPHTPNTRSLYGRAREAIGEKGWMWAGEFWDALERLGHPRRYAEYPLRNPDSPVEFVGFKVRLKEAQP